MIWNLIDPSNALINVSLGGGHGIRLNLFCNPIRNPMAFFVVLGFCLSGCIPWWKW
jgi:hypothetical protein